MDSIATVVEKYQIILNGEPNAPKIGIKKGVITRNFLVNLVNHTKILEQFLFELDLIKRNVTCGKCGHTMKLITSEIIEKQKWNCGKMCNGVRCIHRKSIRHNSWFSGSKLELGKILVLTYEILQKTSSSLLIQEYQISSVTAADWNQYVKEAIAKYMTEHIQPIVGPDVTIEIDESKFGERKYSRGHHVEGQWVFGGIERNSGRCFLETVESRNREVLMESIKRNILPGTKVVSGYWKAYDSLTDEGYIHARVNHSVSFVNENGEHTNTIESTWRHVKASLPEYNRKSDFNLYLKEFMFRKMVASRQENVFHVFLEIIRNMNFDKTDN